MSAWMLWLVTGCYAYTAIEQWQLQHPGLSLMFAAYALANVGILLELQRQN